MDKRDVLKVCMKSGFFLDRGMLEYFVAYEGDILQVIDGLKTLGVKDKILSLEVFDRDKNKLGIKSQAVEVERNSIEVLKDIKGNSGKIEAGDFVGYFRGRFESIRDVLIKKKGIENLSSIRRIGRENGVFSIVGQVYDKRITKNKNLLIEVEDLTGRGIVLVNRDNKQLFERAQRLLLDDILLFKCSGSSKMLFASDFIYPNSCLDSEKFGNEDKFVAFISDLHIGSRGFLESNLVKFVAWLNGEVGDSRTKAMALKVKYLVLAGDNIEGVGVYPGQERDLVIKGCRGQYEKLARILGLIRKDVEIVMVPGLHDAVWIGEPQPGITEKWSGGLSKLENLKMLSNPCVVNMGGLDIMVYYGGSLNGFRRLISGGESLDSVDFMKEILKRRHLVPVYGEMDTVVNKVEDDLVLTELPDVFVLGGQHKVKVSNYNNISLISTSCWQSRTDFEIKVGSEPDPCKVPILNLKSREIKILDFSSGNDSEDVSVEEVVWEKDVDLVCDINRGLKNGKN